jgi:hypothetical protein
MDARYEVLKAEREADRSVVKAFSTPSLGI